MGTWWRTYCIKYEIEKHAEVLLTSKVPLILTELDLWTLVIESQQ